MNKVLIIIGVILLIIGIGVYVHDMYFNPFREYVDKLSSTKPLDSFVTKEEATQDLNYLMKSLEDFHPAYLDGSEHLVTAVKDQYNIELKHLKDKNTVVEVWRATSRITSKMHDGHLSVRANLKGKLISDLTDYNKYEVIEIDGVSINTLYNNFLSQWSYELEEYANYLFYEHGLLTSNIYLEYMGINTEDGVDFTFSTPSGNLKKHYEFVNLKEVQGLELSDDEFVYFNINTNKSVGIFTLNSCTYNDKYQEVLDNFFKEIKEKNIENVIVDLRSNSGGHTDVIKAFFEYVDVDEYTVSRENIVRKGPLLDYAGPYNIVNNKKQEVFKGDLYVLTSNKTFSSAMSFALVISENDLGSVVGEIPGNMPTSYTGHNNGKYQMPNSKLYFMIPWKKSYRPDSSKDELPLIPDYEVTRNDALEKVFELISE